MIISRFGHSSSHKSLSLLSSFQWSEGVKHGFGVLVNPNGEEYVGEFFEGRMEGVGRLTSGNGDVYEGSFARNRFVCLCVCCLCLLSVSEGEREGKG